MSRSTKAALVGLSVVAAAGAAFGFAAVASKPAAASEKKPTPTPNPPNPPRPPPSPPSTWSPAALSPYTGIPNVSETGMGYTLAPGSYRYSLDTMPENPDPIQYAKIVAFAATLPSSQDNQIVYYGDDVAALPSDWPTDDRGPGRTRNAFIVPPGQSVTIPQSFNVRVWKKSA